MSPTVESPNFPSDGKPTQFTLRHLLALSGAFACLFAVLAVSTAGWAPERKARLMGTVFGAVFLIGLLFTWAVLVQRRVQRQAGEFRCWLRRPLAQTAPVFRLIALVVIAVVTLYGLVWLIYFPPMNVVGGQSGKIVVGILGWSLFMSLQLVVWVRMDGGHGITIHERGLLRDRMSFIPWSSIRRYDWNARRPESVTFILTGVPRFNPDVLIVRPRRDDLAEARHWLILLAGRLPGQPLAANVLEFDVGNDGRG